VKVFSSMMSSEGALIRRAVIGDARFFWEVNNHPSVRAQSISTEPIPWETHEPWFARKIADTNALLFVAIVDDVRAAVVRFDLAEGEATIGVAVAPSFRGRGIGARIIVGATEELGRDRPRARPVAWIRPDNVASRRAFERAGYVYVSTGTKEGVLLERFEPPPLPGAPGR
jgi:RimJ/RimL family protein N-acetyltransferase